MWWAQLRVWNDFPPPDEMLWQLCCAHFRMPKRKKTPKRRTDGADGQLDPEKLHAPLSVAEIEALSKRGKPIHAGAMPATAPRGLVKARTN